MDENTHKTNRHADGMADPLSKSSLVPMLVVSLVLTVLGIAVIMMVY